MTRTATDPWSNGTPPHIPQPTTVPAVWLLPGDPDRVDIALAMLDAAELVGQRREYRVGTGSCSGVPVGVCSTGIGGPSTEIAIVELARLGASTVIRIGGMGSFADDLLPGSIGVVTSTTPQSSAASFYLRGGATSDVTLSRLLLRGAKQTGRFCRPIRVASIDGYYVGQGRPVPGFETAAEAQLDSIRRSGVDGVDMEAQTVIGVGSALGLRSAAVLGVHGSRITDSWYEEYEALQHDVVATALFAAAGLSEAG